MLKWSFLGPHPRSRVSGIETWKCAFSQSSEAILSTLWFKNHSFGLLPAAPLRSRAVVPNLFGSRDWFRERQFFHRWWGAGRVGEFGDASSALHLLWTLFLLGFPGGSAGKESTCNAGDPGSIPGSGRSAGEGIGHPLQDSWALLVAQLVKNPPAMQETWFRSLGWEDPLEEGMAPHPGILAWRIPWTTVHGVTEWLSLCYCCCCVSSASDHQALGPGGWGPLG